MSRIIQRRSVFRKFVENGLNSNAVKFTLSPHDAILRHLVLYRVTQASANLNPTLFISDEEGFETYYTALNQNIPAADTTWAICFAPGNVLTDMASQHDGGIFIPLAHELFVKSGWSVNVFMVGANQPIADEWGYNATFERVDP